MDDIEKIAACIRDLKKTAEKLLALSPEFPAVACNAGRILGSVKMLELGVCDAADPVSGPGSCE
jgi:hypothetical protein